MASSMAIRSCMFALVVLAVVSQSHAQSTCNTTLLAAVQGIPQLSLLAAVINASGLANTVSMLDNVTVLAPDNNAFNGTNGLLQLLAANNQNLTTVTAPGANRAASILLYHIIPTPAFAANLTNGQVLPTNLGEDYTLTVVKTATQVTFVGAGSNATVTAADTRVCNSVVHIINRVLLPATTLTAIPVANTTAGSPGSPPTVNAPSPPGTNTSAASTLSTGSLMFGLSGAVAAALLM
ncbi:hypothetical protein M758_11G073300 [Ceratodon purpureus]|uniref:FAS1 domain-containing protein n=1 Tax=Ceratodon purpureus TaxID=3225 RepID=A0A8T0GDE6_CERPU|nr:hypothetical protein KC19_11G075900 [Ceratodon purpureus]KAG0600950.1 hypothetical protein M758_11G073300 [Ceratodon purpureus]